MGLSVLVVYSIYTEFLTMHETTHRQFDIFLFSSMAEYQNWQLSRYICAARFLSDNAILIFLHLTRGNLAEIRPRRSRFC